MANESKTMTNPTEGEVIELKDTNDKSLNGGVANVFNEEQQAELSKLIQSNVDRTAQKLKSEYEQKIRGLQGELDLEKQAKMSEAERAKYERENYEKMKQDFDKERLSFELSKKITDAGLPSKFADMWLQPPKTVEELETRLEDAKSLFGGYKTQVLEGYRKDNVRVPEGTKGNTNNSKVMKRDAFDELTSAQKSTFIQGGGKLE